MKITINSTSLAKALKIAGKIIPGKPSIPVLECFHMEAKGSRLIITATNIEITAKVPVVISTNEEDGIVAVPAKKFTEHISLLPDCDVTLATEGSTMTIAWLKGSTCIQMMNANDYPEIKMPGSDSLMDMPAAELLAALNSTIPCCANDDTRPVLNGVYFDILEDKTRVVATDSKTLTYDTLECTTGKKAGFTVPTLAATLLRSSIRKDAVKVRLTHDDTSVCFNLGDVIIQSRTIIGKFPSYMSVIPADKSFSGTVTVNREGLMDSIRRLAACAEHIKVRLTPLNIMLSAKNLETSSSANEDCDCTYNGQDMEIGFDCRRFLNILENIGTEQICLAVTDPRRAVIASATEETRQNSLSLIMPIMIA